MFEQERLDKGETAIRSVGWSCSKARVPALPIRVWRPKTTTVYIEAESLDSSRFEGGVIFDCITSTLVVLTPNPVENRHLTDSGSMNICPDRQNSPVL